MILIVDKTQSDADRFADMLYFMGYLSCSASYSSLSSMRNMSFSCAVAVYPENVFFNAESAKCALSFLEAPIFAISERANLFPACFDGIFEKGVSASTLITKITNFANNKNIQPPGIYKIMGLDASSTLGTSMYFNTPLPFTKTENMILRALIYSYPKPLYAEDILKLAFRRGRLPELASIRTHISVMNKKFRSSAGRNLISSEKGLGYTVLTPEKSRILTTV